MDSFINNFAYCSLPCFKQGKYTWIDNADLVIHEAGHIFFMFFGKFIHFAGGTLMQIITSFFNRMVFF